MRKPVKEHKSVTGLAFLVESELEKAQVVIAAQSILDKMQKMAEDLAKIEADDIMPMLDSMRLTFGPELTDSFNDITTAKIRQTMEAVKGAKEAITMEVGRLERNINGEMTNDMGMDQPDLGDNEDLSMDDEELGDADSDFDLSDEEAPEEEEGGIDFDTAFDTAANTSAAGRARKESVERNIKALSESSNPDRLIYATFRRTLTETKDAVRSAHAVASAFAIDFQDVVSIVKEGKTFKDEKGKSERNKDRSEDRKSKKRERPSDLDEDLKPWMRKPEDKDFDKPAFERKADYEKMAGPPAVKTVKNKTDESKKPDFLDLDKDGNKSEPMKKAAADKKKAVSEGNKDIPYDDPEMVKGRAIQAYLHKEQAAKKAAADKKKAAAEKVEEKFDMKPTPESKKGMFKDKTQAELKKMLSATKQQMKAHEDKDEKVPHALRTKFSQLTFALRAKHDWGKVSETEAPKKGFKTGGVAEGERDATATTRKPNIVDTLEGMIAAFSHREKALEKSKKERAAKSLTSMGSMKTKEKNVTESKTYVVGWYKSSEDAGQFETKDREAAKEKAKEKRNAGFEVDVKSYDVDRLARSLGEAKSSAGAVKLVMAKKAKQKPFKVSNPKITK